MTTVTIIEDDPVIREWIANTIKGAEGFSCVGMYGECESGVAGVLADRPDVVLMDIVLPGKSGIEGTRKIKEQASEVDVVVLTRCETAQILTRIM